MCGSSPRVRGTDSVEGYYGTLLRFIPACAGNSHFGISQLSRHPVHPRVCGEQFANLDRGLALAGSSPRVRATVSHILSGITTSRFIPACAGNSPAAHLAQAPTAVHPRVCGEQLDPGAMKMEMAGSSPRVRGTAESPDVEPVPVRFIPACAGNRVGNCCYWCPWAVHPRVCGEQLIHGNLTQTRVGSSPRVRGTDPREYPSSPPSRFIPACAGNSPPHLLHTKQTAVHPRVCGEQSGYRVAAFTANGSSPRVRGTVVRLGSLPHTSRFIPACAGNRVGGLIVAAGVAVHPRVCGEQRRKASRSRKDSGSSPRVRGTDPRFLATPPRSRFIPACAGNS